VLSAAYWQTAYELKEKIGDPNYIYPHFLIPSCIIMFVSSVECYFNEIIEVSAFLAAQAGKPVDETYKEVLKEKELGKEKIRAIFTYFSGKSINTSSCVYTDILCAIEVRHCLVHYFPSMTMPINKWPRRLEQAIIRAGIERKHQWTHRIRSAHA
jgi:hypothetical protein